MTTKDNIVSNVRKPRIWKDKWSYGFIFRLFGRQIDFHVTKTEFLDHECLNQYMEGDYTCDYCNPEHSKEEKTE